LSSSWREVDMPPQVAALPRSAGGLPVPYVASWEGEDEMRVAPCRFAFGRAAIFPVRDVVGATRPVFGVMEPSRQREVVMGVCCQVCHTDAGPMENKLTSESRCHWLVELAHKPPTYDRPLILEPWVCGSCLTYALRVCPGLLHVRPDGKRIRLLAVFASQPVAAVVRPKGNLAADVVAQRGVVGYIKIEPLTFHRVAAETFLELGWEEVEQLLNDDPPSDRQVARSR
jgi:hypothetical protein